MFVHVLPKDKDPVPKDLVSLFKYYKLEEDRTIRFKPKFSQIRANTEYSDNRKAIDKLFSILKRYSMDMERYVRYCVVGIGCREARDIARPENLLRYATHLKCIDQYASIVHNFRRSATNLADMCISNGTSPQEEMARIISEGRLAYEYISGRLSKYFIASIGNLDEIFKILDPMSKDELRILFNVADELRQDVQRAFLLYEKKTVSPMSLTAEVIQQKTNQQKTNQGE